MAPSCRNLEEMKHVARWKNLFPMFLLALGYAAPAFAQEAQTVTLGENDNPAIHCDKMWCAYQCAATGHRLEIDLKEANNICYQSGIVHYFTLGQDGECKTIGHESFKK